MSRFALKSKLKDNFPQLTSLEIIERISDGRIGGMWLAEWDIKKAKTRVSEGLTEDEATKLLNDFDSNRSSRYALWQLTL